MYVTITFVYVRLDWMDLRTLDRHRRHARRATVGDERDPSCQGTGSQPAAVSVSLRLLRRHFDDPLLRRTGNTYALTRLAVQLKEYPGSRSTPRS